MIYVNMWNLGQFRENLMLSITTFKKVDFFFYFCQYLHIGTGILSFGGDVFRL